MAKVKTITCLGEYGSICGFSAEGSSTFRIYTVSGSVREIRRIWKALDTADGPQQYRLLCRLMDLGALQPC